MGTVAVDFDGVIHDYLDGWRDGTLYGGLVPGADGALRALQQRHAVYVHTCRSPLTDVAEWFTARTGIPAVVDVGEVTFWTDRETVLVTGRKLPAIAYIDDRGLRFENWDQALIDLESYEPPRARSAGRGRR